MAAGSNGLPTRMDRATTTMVCSGLWLLFWAVCTMVGCFPPLEEPPDSGADGGDISDADSGDGDADGAGEPIELEVVVQERPGCRGFPWSPAGPPLSDALVQVQSELGTWTSATDNRGSATLSFDGRAPFAITVALNGYSPVVSYVGLDEEMLRERLDGEGRLAVQLCDAEAELPEFYTTKVMASGLPNQARWYSGRFSYANTRIDDPHASRFADGWLGPGDSTSRFHPYRAERVDERSETITAFTVRHRGGVEFIDEIVELDILNRPLRSQWTVFEFTPSGGSVVLEAIDDVTVVLGDASNPLEPFRTYGPLLHPALLAPYEPAEQGTGPVRGGAVNFRETPEETTLDVHFRQRPGVELRWEINAILAEGETPWQTPPRSRRFMSGTPEAGRTYQVLGIPHVIAPETSPALLSAHFACRRVARAEHYRFDIVRLDPEMANLDMGEELSHNIVWSVWIDADTPDLHIGFVLPHLPYGYAPPRIDTAGFVFHAYRNLIVEGREPAAGPYVDFEHSISAGGVVWLQWQSEADK